MGTGKMSEEEIPKLRVYEGEGMTLMNKKVIIENSDFYTKESVHEREEWYKKRLEKLYQMIFDYVANSETNINHNDLFWEASEIQKQLERKE